MKVLVILFLAIMGSMFMAGVFGVAGFLLGAALSDPRYAPAWGLYALPIGAIVGLGAGYKLSISMLKGRGEGDSAGSEKS